jgi:tRNA (adenine37-N6)-methyltransferase
MENTYTVKPIGVIRNDGERTWMEISPCYKDALLGLEGFSHIHVMYWFHENDTPELRSILQVHPRKDPGNPLTGVFATHSPMRPNLIALTLCRILSIQGTIIEVEDMDARDGSPLVDIKCYIPYGQTGPIQTPGWV